MNPLEFAGEVILVSASGVLSPGPLFFTLPTTKAGSNHVPEL